jgi:hypothetical protein
VFPDVVSADCPAADSADAAGTDYAEGTDHGSTDSVAPDTSTDSLAKNQCANEYCFQRTVPEASSF